ATAPRSLTVAAPKEGAARKSAATHHQLPYDREIILDRHIKVFRLHDDGQTHVGAIIANLQQEVPGMAASQWPLGASVVLFQQVFHRGGIMRATDGRSKE